jgi:bifunctional isochorismate lyase/aryl carrier protein
MPLPKISVDTVHAEPTGERTALVDQLRSELAELLEEGDRDSISPHESLFDRGLDSIRLMVLVERFQQLGVPVTFGDLAEQPTLFAWAALIDAHSQIR